MALLQISEPGMAPAPHQRRLAVGIDLGTTHSLVASVRSGAAEVLADEYGDVLLPSAVRYLEGGRVSIGAEALSHQADDAANTLVSFKRLMGRSAAEAREHAAGFDVVEGEGMVRLRTQHGVVSPVEVSAQVLATLRQRAEDVLGDDLVGAVITVPAYFDDAQRQATKDAAQLAGLNVLRLLNEPTAAAIAYGLDQNAEGVFVVYDLGGGTFDVSILRLERGVFEVIATAGDTALGGDDLDHAIVAWIQNNWNVRTLIPADMRALLAAARRAREQLSSANEATLEHTLSTGYTVVAQLTRERFEALAEPLVARTVEIVRRALRDADLTAEDIDGVVLVGGATRTPLVRARVGQVFGREPLVDHNPDEVVALGAAMQANVLAGNAAPGEDWLLLDVLPLSLGLETYGGLVERVIPRNTTLPVARAQEFTTFKDGQSAMAIHVVQGERELVSDCRSLARFELRGIPAMAAGAARIRVTFQVDADGLLSVTAREQSQGVQAAVTVKPAYGLDDDTVARMLADGMASAGADMRMRSLREQQVEAARLLEAVHAALEHDADLLQPEELVALEAQMDQLRVLAAEPDDTADAEQLRLAVAQAATATEEFAARRMDRSIRSALAGRTLDELN